MNAHEIEILLVEDNLSDAELTIRALKKNNLSNKVIHLDNGAAALDYIFTTGIYAGREATNLPKVILLDLNMPKIGGIEVLNKLKADERTKKIPIVVLTSSKEDPDIQKCYALGANSYIVKPVEFEDFIKTVSNLGIYWIMQNQASQI